MVELIHQLSGLVLSEKPLLVLMGVVQSTSRFVIEYQSLLLVNLELNICSQEEVRKGKHQHVHFMNRIDSPVFISGFHLQHFSLHFLDEQLLSHSIFPVKNVFMKILNRN